MSDQIEIVKLSEVKALMNYTSAKYMPKFVFNQHTEDDINEAFDAYQAIDFQLKEQNFAGILDQKLTKEENVRNMIRQSIAKNNSTSHSH